MVLCLCLHAHVHAFGLQMFIHSLTLKVDMFLPSGHENETERWRADSERRRCDFYTGSLTTTVSGSSLKMNVRESLF